MGPIAMISSLDPIGLFLALLVGVSLGFFGGGGSILTVPLLVYVFGQEPKQAIAGSLLIVGIASLSGAFSRWRAGDVDVRAGTTFGLAAMAGAYLGGRLAVWIDGGVLLLLFAAMMVVTSVAMWRGRAEDASARKPAASRLVAQGLAVGGFTGLIGAGGGFLIVPALSLWAGLPMPTAIGTSLFIIVLKSGAAFVGYASHVGVDLALVGAVAGCAMLGSFAGTRLARYVEPSSLRRAFAAFVFTMALVILTREGALFLRTLSDAVPTTAPQAMFALLALGLGVVAGRSAGGPLARSANHAAFEQGEGI